MVGRHHGHIFPRGVKKRLKSRAPQNPVENQARNFAAWARGAGEMFVLAPRSGRKIGFVPISVEPAHQPRHTCEGPGRFTHARERRDLTPGHPYVFQNRCHMGFIPIVGLIPWPVGGWRYHTACRACHLQQPDMLWCRQASSTCITTPQHGASPAPLGAATQYNFTNER